MDLSDGLITGGILNHLHRIFTGNYAVKIRVDACALLLDFVKSCGNLVEVHPEEARRYMHEIIQSWMGVLIENMVDVQLGVVVGKTLGVICKGCRVGGLDMFERCCSILQGYHERYVAEFIEAEAAERGVEVLIMGVLDLMAVLLERDDVTAWLDNGDNMIGVLGLVLNYCVLGKREAVSWEESVGEVVCEENEASFTVTLRKRGLEFVLTLEEGYKGVLPGLLYTGARVVAGGDWKGVEAVLFVVSGLSQEYIDAGEGVGELIGMTMGLVKGTGTPVVLNGRALMFLAKFDGILNVGQIGGVARECVRRIEAYPGIDLGKIYDIIALDKIAQGGRISGTICQSSVGGLVKCLEGCGVDDLNQDVVGQVLSCLLSVVGGMTPEEVGSVAGGVGEFMLKIWAGFSFSSDVYISGYLVELVEVFAGNETCRAAFEAKFVPCLAQVLAGCYDLFLAEEGAGDGGAGVLFEDMVVPRENVAGMAPTSVDMLTVLAKSGGGPIDPGYVGTVFPLLVRILVRFDNTAMLQNGQEFLTVLVGKDFQGIVAWRDERGKSGLEVVIEVVAKLLDPNADESGSVFVGALITKLIVRSGDALTDVLPDLLRAVTLRLDTAKNATFIQTLVMVFAQLFVRGTYPMETIVSFLEGLRVGDRTGLEMLVNVWCENHGSFVGFYECKVSAVGLGKLVAEARTAGIVVRGDIVVTREIMTRSRARKAPDVWTSVAFGVKVVKLLLADYGGYLNGGRGEAEEVSGSDEGEVWEDCAGGFAGFGAGELKQLGELGGGAGKSEDDADVVGDPVYGWDMVEWIGGLFREMLGGRVDAVLGELNESERQLMRGIMQ
jgi:hypothetical protein